MFLAVTVGEGISTVILLILLILLAIGPLILCRVAIRVSEEQYSNDTNREMWRQELYLRAVFSFPAAAVLFTGIAIIVGVGVYGLPLTEEQSKSGRTTKSRNPQVNISRTDIR